MNHKNLHEAASILTMIMHAFVQYAEFRTQRYSHSVKIVLVNLNIIFQAIRNGRKVKKEVDGITD